MKSFKRLLNEAKSFTVWHGDDFNTTRLDPKLMFQKSGNQQVGVGIYFSNTINIAKTYGKNIVYTTIAMKNFRDGDDDIDRVLSDREGIAIIKYMHEKDEDFWYIFSDYCGATEPEDVDDYMYECLWDAMGAQQASDWQIEMCQAGNAKDFITAWNKFTKIHGLYELSSGFFSIINTKYKLTKEKYNA